MQARVIVLGRAKGIDSLTYAIPPAMDHAIECGHRVLVPLRSRKVTGVVVEVGSDLDADGPALKPILEVLEPTPLFDRPHRELVEFMASYYLVPIEEAWRSVVPAVARVESRHKLKLVREPALLEAAAFKELERAIIEALSKSPKTARQLARFGPDREVIAAVNRLMAHGMIGVYEATRGRHRASPVQVPAAQSSCAGNESSLGEAFELNEEQSLALGTIGPAISGRRAETFLLWGVTASGKTEVYMRLAAQCLDAGRQVLVMVPEIALTDQLVRSFRSRFGANVAVAHSAQNVSERWASWRSAMNGQARIMIGPRSTIFAPIPDLGLIVVDEEHDPAYKQEEGIRYHARDLAVALGKFSQCPVALGSATPSAESFANARRGRYRMVQLSRRIQNRPFAEVEIIDLRQESRPAADPAHEPRGRGFQAGDSAADPGTAAVPLSARLIGAMRENLARGGQSVIFLNRRGYHNFLQCHLCGAVITCPNCSVSTTFHLHDRSLRCHHCGYRAAAPDHCPECRGLGLAGQGFGTEQLVSAIMEVLPRARIERMDSDTSRRKGARTALVEALARGEIDVLVGTQMITKGFDLPGVTLVAVVLADLTLNLPDFRSAERTFQLLTQVAGRAGRGDRLGRVLIQTYAPHHYSIRAARDQNYARFIRQELRLRRELLYPPYVRIALIRIEGVRPQSVGEIASKTAAALAGTGRKEAMRVLGPAPAPIEKIKQRYRWQVMVKSPSFAAMREALTTMRTEVGPGADRHDVRLTIDIDPVNMM